MAFTNEQLTEVVEVTSGSTNDLVTVAGSKKVFIRSIMCFDRGSAATAKIYVVPNGSSAAATNQIFQLALNTSETALVEPVYPIVMDTTGDKLVVEATSGTINFMAVGDREA